MKRSWITWPIVGGVILLLTLFLALQYRWQAKASEAEREIMQRRVETDTRRFAEDFNREIQAAYFNFQMDAESWDASNWTEFNERYDYWRSKTEFPALVRDFYYLKTDSNECLRYDPDKRMFQPQETTPEVSELKKRVEDEKTFKPIYQDAFAMAMPVHPAGHKLERIMISRSAEPHPAVLEMPKRAGHLLILLDRDVVTTQILPILTKKHFPDGSFKIKVIDNDRQAVFQSAGEVESADASARLLTFSPEDMLFFSNKEVLPRTSTRQRGPSVFVNQHVESQTLRHEAAEANSTKTFTFELNSDGSKKRTTMVRKADDGGDGWTLGVEHMSGSVDAFVSGEQNKRMITGLAIYLLVVGAILAITVSAMRSQKFAQRQIDFVSSVSHEFRTPLAVIYSAGENLADGVTNDRTQIERYGTLIKSEGKKLSSMVEQILEFAGARSGKKRYTFSETNVNDVVRTSLESCLPSLKEDGFSVESQFAEQLPSLNADAESLSTAVQNLIHNAAKYNNGSRWIRVSTSSKNGLVAINVEDRGIGISPGDMKKIFEPFYRSKEVVDAQIHGNGLGLSLVKEIAEAHNGRVSAQSDHGKGSKFTIELPEL
jgi:signal transduction histidine kinase